KIVTVTAPPTGATTWAYSNDLGLVIHTLAHSFNGRFTEVAATYDELGRKTAESKPHIGGPDPMYWTTTGYDGFGRAQEGTQDLGNTNDPTVSARDDVTTTLAGSTVTTTHTVAGSIETRTEVKNALGKVQTVTDTTGATISYAYDAEGNLTQTFPPPGQAGVS